jgi:hypothetical protein
VPGQSLEDAQADCDIPGIDSGLIRGTYEGQDGSWKDTKGLLVYVRDDRKLLETVQS